MAIMKVGPAGIETISGAMKRPKKLQGHNHGNYLVATHRTAESENPNCQRVYSFDADRYNRTTALTAKEQAQREKFGSICAAVRARRKDLSKIATDTENFLAQRETGKKTMRSYLWSLEKQAYEASHNG